MVSQDHLPFILAELERHVRSLTMKERNERKAIDEIIRSTMEWYDRAGRDRGYPTLADEARQHLHDLLTKEAPRVVARSNASDLVNDLTAIESSLAASGLRLSDERRMRSELEDLRRALLRNGRYRPEDDDAMIRMAALVRKGQGAWADDNNDLIERYLGRGRWWLS
jgi:hypothetical protein